MAPNTQKTHKVYKTQDYDRFVVSAGNRELKPTNLNKTRQSLIKYGWLRSNPLICFFEHGKFVIYDGQHRFAIAKELNIPIWYSIEVIKFDIADIQTGKPWVTADYLYEYRKQGSKSYIELSDYCQTYGIPIATAILFFTGNLSSNKKLKDDFEAGRFIITDSETPYIISDVSKALRECGFNASKVATQGIFLKSLSRCLLIEDFNIARFKEKALKYSSFLENSTLEESLNSIEAVYNRQVPLRNKLDIAYLVNKEIQRRRFVLDDQIKEPA